MTTEEILQGNKLIAEFMGYKALLNGSYNIECPHDGVGFHLETMKYNWSWDWLMPVVEKIEMLGYNVISGIFIDDETQKPSGEHWAQIDSKPIVDINSLINITGKSSKLLAIYQAVIEFITWYNKNVTSEDEEILIIKEGDLLMLDNKIVKCIGFGANTNIIKIEDKFEPYVHKSHFRKIL